MKTLISMTDFVLEQDKLVRRKLINPYQFTMIITDYASFLKQPLKLEMFVPCDDDGNVLEEPCSIGVGNEFYYERVLDQYEQSKEKVLFEGFHSIGDKEIELLNSDNWISFTEKSIDFTNEFGNETQIYRIEDLIELELKLTPTAL